MVRTTPCFVDLCSHSYLFIGTFVVRNQAKEPFMSMKNDERLTHIQNTQLCIDATASF